MAFVTTRFVTTGLHCPSCSMLIQMDVGALEGVQSATADHRSGIAEVTYDPNLISAEDIIGAIVALGYGAEPADA